MPKIVFTLTFIAALSCMPFLFSFKKPTASKAKYHQLFYSGGITGYSAAGCVCHGGATANVTVGITGLPPSPIVGVTYPLTFTLTGANAYAGLNIAVSSGTLVNADGETQVIGNEITHTTPKALTANSVNFSFNWTPTVAGDVTFTYAGNNVDFTGTNANDFWNNGSLIVPVQTLPVKISSIKGVSMNSVNTIFWTAEQEVNFRQYEIEYSCNGVDFNRAGTVLPNPVNTHTKYYEFTHNNVDCATPKIFYRLRLLDKDGRYQYSDIVSLGRNTKEVKASIYPNPVSSPAQPLIVHTGTKRALQIQLLTASGKILQTYRNTIHMVNPVALPVGLPRGNYFIRIYFQNKTTEILGFVY